MVYKTRFGKNSNKHNVFHVVCIREVLGSNSRQETATLTEVYLGSARVPAVVILISGYGIFFPLPSHSPVSPTSSVTRTVSPSDRPDRQNFYSLASHCLSPYTRR
jgi:hypothetical protein